MQNAECRMQNCLKLGVLSLDGTSFFVGLLVVYRRGDPVWSPDASVITMLLFIDAIVAQFCGV